MKLEALTMTALVAIHNVLSADKPATMKTFSQRSKAVARIEKLAAEQGVDVSSRFMEDGSEIAKAPAVVEALKVLGMTAEDLNAGLKSAAEQGAAATEEEPVAPPASTSVLGMLTAKDRPADKPARPRRTAKTAGEPVEKKEKGPVIRAVAEALLLEVVSHDEDKRPYGHGYDFILDSIHKQFVGAKTTVACLRWYAVHMRERGERVPNRPRAVPTKKAA